MLSHPLLVEAIEQCFVAVAIHNNKPGRDAEILQRFQEKSWNNPVVRLVDGAGKDLVARRGGVYSVAGIAGRMIKALAAAKRPVPGYLQVLAGVPAKRYLHKATFAMY